ncbi:HNH endonuclease [Tumebacillus flagellatus]|uniref:HNH nuclease domain-containing protein n=1 Tax=Tumebacillus flagellatus TaxID=1157490 RepID=A0A074LR19_9BACL|nr:HNH endonuclease [Tumebacillus flagellatus]KEO83534.1 hypothetical protein EL26_08955 [Tumebacillus flagellatus]
MRPIERGTHPVNPNGIAVSFSHYSDARIHLIDHLGEYCSYCEMKLESGLAVEHVKPKSRHPQLERTWENFLLACPNCNPTKGDEDEDVHLPDYVWPDSDDTHLAFTYNPDGRVLAALTPMHTQAQNMLQLVGLDKIPLPHESSDRRLRNRHTKYQMALRYHRELSQRPDDKQYRQIITDLAKESGYWSVWVTVFRDDPDMIRRFNEAYPGTSPHCFETETYQAKSRHNRP